MSDLARTFARSKLVALPPESPLLEEDGAGFTAAHPRSSTEDDGDSSSASSMSSTGTIVPSASGPYKSAVALPWSNFFAQELWLRDAEDGRAAKYHAYLSPVAGEKSPLVVLHHGAGSSAMSWALFALELKRLLPEAGILAVEAREHGSVVYDGATGEVDGDLSIDKLAADLERVLKLTAARQGWQAMPRILLVGHSLGGAVVTHFASHGPPDLRAKMIGFASLDVVEGSAMDALISMNAYLSTRPDAFTSLDQAINWHLRSRTLRNLESAKASVPSLLLRREDGKWGWRTDLSRTEQYWSNWFDGMSGKFLTGRGAKLLLLAGTDRLDKELMIGQMQGKFQLQVFPEAGHFIQEDIPEKTAEVIAAFFKRNDRSALVLPPKVSDLLAQGKKV